MKIENLNKTLHEKTSNNLFDPSMYFVLGPVAMLLMCAIFVLKGRPKKSNNVRKKTLQQLLEEGNREAAIHEVNKILDSGEKIDDLVKRANALSRPSYSFTMK